MAPPNPLREALSSGRFCYMVELVASASTAEAKLWDIAAGLAQIPEVVGAGITSYAGGSPGHDPIRVAEAAREQRADSQRPPDLRQSRSSGNSQRARSTDGAWDRKCFRDHRRLAEGRGAGNSSVRGRFRPVGGDDQRSAGGERLAVLIFLLPFRRSNIPKPIAPINI